MLWFQFQAIQIPVASTTISLFDIIIRRCICTSCKTKSVYSILFIILGYMCFCIMSTTNLNASRRPRRRAHERETRKIHVKCGKTKERIKIIMNKFVYLENLHSKWIFLVFFRMHRVCVCRLSRFTFTYFSIWISHGVLWCLCCSSSGIYAHVLFRPFHAILLANMCARHSEWNFIRKWI